MRHWLMKSEPGDYSIADLARDKREWWTGVRNYQARNFMTQMRRGDGVLFYHSSCAQPGVYGTAKVCAESAPDATQFERGGKYYDSSSTREKPRWFCPQIVFARKFKEPWLLSDIREHRALAKMIILRRGNRLSVTPVTAAEWNILSAPPKK